MMKYKMIHLLLAVFFMTTCFSCGPKTRVVLMPGPDGKIGKVSVTAGGKTTILDKAYESARVSRPGASVKNTGVMKQRMVAEIFRDALHIQPQPPETFILYFHSGTTRLTGTSTDLISKILENIKKRETADISVVGHTDRVGAGSDNEILSKRRTRKIKEMLVDAGIDSQSIATAFHGENVPLVPTADNVPEPRNRRVEVMIR